MGDVESGRLRGCIAYLALLAWVEVGRKASDGIVREGGRQEVLIAVGGAAAAGRVELVVVVVEAARGLHL